MPKMFAHDDRALTRVGEATVREQENEDAAYEIGFQLHTLVEDMLLAVDLRMTDWFRYRDQVTELERVHHMLFQAALELHKLGLLTEKPR